MEHFVEKLMMPTKPVVRSGRTLWDTDYSEIDRDLIGTNIMTVSNSHLPNDMIAPAQGFAFFNRLKTTKEILKKYSVSFWD